MVLHPVLRHVFAVISVLALIVLSWSGIEDGLHQVGQSNTRPQLVQVIAELVSGVMALAMILIAFVARRSAWLAEFLFVVSIATSAGLATVVWGGRSVTAGVLSFLAGGILAGLIAWMFRVGVEHARGRA